MHIQASDFSAAKKVVLRQQKTERLNQCRHGGSNVDNGGSNCIDHPKVKSAGTLWNLRTQNSERSNKALLITPKCDESTPLTTTKVYPWVISKRVDERHLKTVWLKITLRDDRIGLILRMYTDYNIGVISIHVY